MFLETQIQPETGFGCTIMDSVVDNFLEVWVGTQTNGRMVLGLTVDRAPGDVGSAIHRDEDARHKKEIEDVPVEEIQLLISQLQRAVAANHKKNR